MGIVWQVEHKIGRAEDALKSFVNCRSVVRRPLHYLVECLIKGGGAINQRIHVSGLIARTCVDKEIQRPVCIRSYCVKEMSRPRDRPNYPCWLSNGPRLHSTVNYRSPSAEQRSAAISCHNRSRKLHTVANPPVE